MKKRILLSLVSFFMMTTTWATLKEMYQMTVTADANGKTGATATLTLNLKNKDLPINWSCIVTLPEGVTYVDGSLAIVEGRYPEGYNPEPKATVNGNGTVTFTCEGEDGVTLTNTAGAVATFEVAVAITVEPGDYAVIVNESTVATANGNVYNWPNANEFTWTIEAGSTAKKGDVNTDGSVDVADVVAILNKMAGQEVSGNADVNNDGSVDVADVVAILNIMAGAE